MINKINVDGFEYNVGDNKAKLVASGIYDNEIGGFVFGQDEVTKSNHFYVARVTDISEYIYYYSDVFGALSWMQPVKIHAADTRTGAYQEVIVLYEQFNVDGNWIWIFQDAGEFTDGDIMEIYELPFTLGGN